MSILQVLPSHMDLEEQIIDVLVKSPNILALDIVAMLAKVNGQPIDKTKVNSLLYGKLRNRVIKDKSYRWRLNDHTNDKVSINDANSKISVDSDTNLLCCAEIVDFNKLMSSEKPHFLISDELWDLWLKTLQDSNVRFTKVSEIADSLKLYWPEAKQYQDVSYYLNWSLFDLFEISDIPIKKTLFLCIAEAAINRTIITNNTAETPDASNGSAATIKQAGQYNCNGVPYEINRKIDIISDEANNVIKNESPVVEETVLKSLLAAADPLDLINEDIWGKWTAKLSATTVGTEKIADFAKLLDLHWEYIYRNECLSDYLNSTLQDIRNIPNWTCKKRAIVICVAHAALKLNGIISGSEWQNPTSSDVRTSSYELTDDENRVIALFKEGQKSAIGISRMIGISPSTVINILQNKRLIANSSYNNFYSYGEILDCLYEALHANGLTFGDWCSSICVLPISVKQSLTQLKYSGEMNNKDMKMVNFLKEDFPDAYESILQTFGRSKGTYQLDLLDTKTIGISRTSSEPINVEPDIGKLFNEGMGLISIAHNTGKSALSIFRILVKLKLIKHRTVSGYSLTKIPIVLRESLKNDGVNFGMWCSSLNTSPTNVVKAIANLMSGEYIPENARKAITMMQEAYPEVYEQISFQNTESAINEVPKHEKYGNTNIEITYEDIFYADNPIDLLPIGVWDKWREVLINDNASTQYISDIINEIGLLYWHPNWKDEKISAYLHFSLNDIREIQLPGKVRTIVICIAYLATNALSKLDVDYIKTDSLIENITDNYYCEVDNKTSVKSYCNATPVSLIGDYNNDFLLKMTLKEFVGSTDSSVRLRNSIANAFTDGTCPFRTIEEYLNAKEFPVQKMLRIPNLGRKTAYELDNLIRENVESLDLNKCPNDSENNVDFSCIPEFAWNGIKLDDKCLEQNIYDLVQSNPTSVRLRNCFDRFYKEETFPCRTVKDFLIGGDNVIKALLRYEHFGRTSANELKELVESFLLAQENNPNENLAPKGVSELIYNLLEQLKPQERKVLSYRYGLDEENVLTLEEIGKQLGLTRSRIGQIEIKAIGRLSHKSNREQILDVLSRDNMRVFSSLADASGVVWKRGMTRLPGASLLAVEITHDSFSEWINSISVEFKAGWLRVDLFTPEFNACQQKIKDILASIRLPTPLAIIFKMLEEDANFVKLCASLLDGVYLFNGIIFPSRPGRRKQRQAHLYQLLQSSTCKQLEPLVEKHNDIFPSIQCSTRDALIVMAEAPHLFLSLNDYGWTALGQNTFDYPIEISNVIEESPSVNNEEKESNEEVYGNLVSAVKQVMEEHGPLHFVPLRERFIESFGDLYAPNSLAPVLLTYKDFVRLSPGVHGLKSHLGSEVLSSYKEQLLSEVDCFLYVLSRWAGEPMHAYPSWTPEMEYSWCKWAQRELNEPLFSALMAVVEPNDWSVADEERRHWLEVKNKKAHYSLQFVHKHSLSACAPTLRELYAIMVVAKDQSSMNWIRVNRILGHRLNNQYSATYLAMLVALGALESTDHWQLPHSPGKRLPELANELCLLLCKKEDISWPSDLAKSYLLEMENTNRFSNLGWVEKDELEALLDLLVCGKLSEFKSDSRNDRRAPKVCILENLLGEKEQSDKHDRFAGLIDELMSDGYSGE